MRAHNKNNRQKHTSNPLASAKPLAARRNDEILNRCALRNEGHFDASQHTSHETDGDSDDDADSKSVEAAATVPGHRRIVHPEEGVRRSGQGIANVYWVTFAKDTAFRRPSCILSCAKASSGAGRDEQSGLRFIAADARPLQDPGGCRNHSQPVKIPVFCMARHPPTGLCMLLLLLSLSVRC